MVKEQLVVGLEISSKVAPDPICEPCIAGKMHAKIALSLGVKIKTLRDDKVG
jgi:hypothetical protein